MWKGTAEHESLQGHAFRVQQGEEALSAMVRGTGQGLRDARQGPPVTADPIITGLGVALPAAHGRKRARRRRRTHAEHRGNRAGRRILEPPLIDGRTETISDGKGGHGGVVGYQAAQAVLVGKEGRSHHILLCNRVPVHEPDSLHEASLVGAQVYGIRHGLTPGGRA